MGIWKQGDMDVSGFGPRDGTWKAAAAVSEATDHIQKLRRLKPALSFLGERKKTTGLLALFGLPVVLLAHISREKNLQCMEY